MIEKFQDETFLQKICLTIVLEFNNKNKNLIYDKNISKTFDDVWNYFHLNNLLDTTEWLDFGKTLIATYKNC